MENTIKFKAIYEDKLNGYFRITLCQNIPGNIDTLVITDFLLQYSITLLSSHIICLMEAR